MMQMDKDGEMSQERIHLLENKSETYSLTFSKSKIGTRIWPDFTAPENYTGGNLVDGKFRCYSCAGEVSECLSDASRHLGNFF